MSNRTRTRPTFVKVIYFPKREVSVLSTTGSFKERSQRPSEARLKLEALFTKPVLL